MKKIHTQNEIVDNNSKQIYYFAKLLETQPDVFYQVAEYLPFVIFQSERESLNWSWGNKFGLDFFEVKQGCAPDLSKISQKANAEVLDFNISKIENFGRENDKNGICSYYQLYNFEDEKQWVATSKLITKENKYFSISYLMDDSVGFGNHIHNILDTTLSDVNAWRRFQSLSKKEKTILQLLANGKSSKEIAEMSFISEHTVRTHRKNIYHKIAVKNLHDLIKFAEAFKLIDAF